MSTDSLVQKSKMLARWLRHKPDAIGLRLDARGWANVDELLRNAADSGHELTREELAQIIAENDKQRFTLSDDGRRIRAAQGHSLAVKLDAPVTKPPPALYHGTVGKFLASIRKNGLQPGTRQHVHLSTTRETAEAVGGRRGKPVVLVIETYPLVRDGFEFRRAENGVWLIDEVPAKYIIFPAARQ